MISCFAVNQKGRGINLRHYLQLAMIVFLCLSRKKRHEGQRIVWFVKIKELLEHVKATDRVCTVV